jgi:hypothetical protein
VKEVGTIKIGFEYGRRLEEVVGWERDPVYSEGLGIAPEKAMKGDAKSHETG